MTLRQLVRVCMFIRCTWKDALCDPDYIKKEYTDMGLCYTFNWNPSAVLESKDAGKQRASHCTTAAL